VEGVVGCGGTALIVTTGFAANCFRPQGSQSSQGFLTFAVQSNPTTL
jgi:hypothetical protein